MLGHGGSSAGSYLGDPTSPIPSHCAVIILFQSVAVHHLPCLALQELKCHIYQWHVFDAPSGDKVGMLTHTYEHKTPRNIEVTIYNHQSDSPLYVWPDA